MTGAYERDHVLSVSARVIGESKNAIHCEFETKGKGVLALIWSVRCWQVDPASHHRRPHLAIRKQRITRSFANVWQAESTFKPAELREVGLVFQDQQLLPHLRAGGIFSTHQKGRTNPQGEMGGSCPSRYRSIT